MLTLYVYRCVHFICVAVFLGIAYIRMSGWHWEEQFCTVNRKLGKYRRYSHNGSQKGGLTVAMFSMPNPAFALCF